MTVFQIDLQGNIKDVFDDFTMHIFELSKGFEEAFICASDEQLKKFHLNLRELFNVLNWELGYNDPLPTDLSRLFRVVTDYNEQMGKNPLRLDELLK